MTQHVSSPERKEQSTINSVSGETILQEGRENEIIFRQKKTKRNFYQQTYH